MKESLSSGQIAQYCNVHPRTVIRWLERGHLKGFKLPGRGNNRILVTDFIDFLHQNQMPIPEELHEHIKQIEPPHVLVVDDDPIMAKAIARRFHLKGWQVDIALDGFQAGLRVSEHCPDLMVLDLMMPRMDGLALLDCLKQESLLDKISVMVLSAAGDEQLQKAKQAGACLALAKPFEPNQLVDMANQLLTTDREGNQ